MHDAFSRYLAVLARWPSTEIEGAMNRAPSWAYDWITYGDGWVPTIEFEKTTIQQLAASAAAIQVGLLRIQLGAESIEGLMPDENKGLSLFDHVKRS